MGTASELLDWLNELIFLAETERWQKSDSTKGGTMVATNTTGMQLLRRLQQLEQRLENLAGHVKALQRHTAELDDLRNEVGRLKLEVEERREE